MKRQRALPLLLLAALAAAAPPARACTTFCLKGKGGTGPVFGKNYDWMVPDGLVFINKRGVSRTSAPPETGKPAKWVSKHGSLTFNQYGRDFPSGGMNEKGLAIELMWLDETQYPGPGGQPVISCLEWIQYQLDNYATAAEVARHAGDLRIDSFAKVHFLVCDKGGSCATVEFLEGRPVVHTGDKLPARALANHPYGTSVEFKRRNPEGSKALEGTGSLARFSRAAARVEGYKSGDPIRYAFDTLEDVAQPGYTQWSIVYDQAAGRVHWRTAQNPRVRTVALSSFDFSCGTPVKLLDIHEGEGEVASRFTDYDPKRNRELVESSFRKTPFLRGAPPEEKAMAIRHPETASCVAGAGRR